MLPGMEDLPDRIDLADVNLFAGGAPHSIFSHLRRECPVYCNPEEDGKEFWALTRYDDVLAVSR
jgi:cholest-4-en-3-one 26-monooxygenase